MLKAHQKMKQTPAGEIPVDWECVEIGTLLDSLDSGFSLRASAIPAGPNEAGVLKLNAVTNGHFHPRRNKLIPAEHRTKARTSPTRNSVIITRSNTPELVGEVGYVSRNYPNLFLPDTMWRLVFSPVKKVSPRFIGYVLSSGAIRRKIKLQASGTSANMKKLQKKNFSKLYVPAPPLPEQQKIADILSTWDRALETLDALISAKEAQKRGLMQQLLTGKTRLPGFSGTWHRLPLQSLGAFQKGKGIRKSDLQREGVPVVRYADLYTKYTGVINQVNSFVSEKTAKTATEIQYGDILFPSSGETAKDIGLCSANCIPFKVVTGGDTIIFRPEQDLNSTFIALQLRTNEWRKEFYKRGQGNSVVHIYTRDVIAMNCSIPPLDEQHAIADVLDTADRELAVLRRKREALEEQKRGLMQQLLTGRIRVKPAEAPSGGAIVEEEAACNA